MTGHTSVSLKAEKELKATAIFLIPVKIAPPIKESQILKSLL